MCPIYPYSKAKSMNYRIINTIQHYDQFHAIELSRKEARKLILELLILEDQEADQ